jgi:HD-GYP domain-containing protein (c-di-GMP phosphodiesterase class II)
MGRILAVAAQYSFRRVIGVELSLKLSHIGEENINKAVPNLRCKDIQIITVDAASLDQVYALAATEDTKKAHGSGHSERVASIAEAIGSNLGLSSDELADLCGAALLYDIGKIGISDAILNKPDPLIPLEWEIVKKHSIEGANIVSQIKQISNLAPLVRHHHERYDGSGYPDGLKRQEIPLGSRIICIADAYDTMVTPRSYGNVMSRNEALIELEHCSGTQFDPEIIKVVSITYLIQA